MSGNSKSGDVLNDVARGRGEDNDDAGNDVKVSVTSGFFIKSLNFQIFRLSIKKWC